MTQKFQPIMYPPTVPELSPSLGTNELIRRLKLLCEALRDIDQDSNEANKYKSLAIHLSSDFLMSSSSREIRIYVACCIGEILRIFAPDAPYGDPHQLKTVLMFLVKQLRGLDSPKDPLHVHYYLLLENLAMVKTMNIILELEESQEFIVVMFKLFFAILQSDGISEKVQGMLIEILVSIVKDCDYLSVEALDSLLINLIEPHKTQNRVAYKCARNFIDVTNTAIQGHLETYLLTTIAEGKNTESSLGEFVFEIVYEIHKILPQVMTRIWSKLEEKIISSETKDRIDTVRLLAKLFSDTESAAYEECPSLWNLFLARFNDKAHEIRLQCIKASVDLMINHSKLRKDITEVLVQRFRDMDESVRVQTVTTVLTAAKKDFSIVTDEIMMCIKDRTLDKKFKVRREAVLCLGSFYRKVILNPEATATDLKRVAFIKNKLLHMYYQQNLEDRILCEKLVNTCLVPFLLETEDRMTKFYHLYCTIDENASKAFNEIFRQQSHIRTLLRNIINCENSENNTDVVEVQLQRLKQLSEYFLDPRAYDNLKTFYDYMVDDPQMAKIMHYIVDDDYTTVDVQNHVKTLLSKVGPHSKYWNVHGTIRALLERAAPILVDRQSIEFLIGKVRRSTNPSQVEFALDDEASPEQIMRRGFNLLLLMSNAFPAAFYTEDSLSMLLDFLKENNEAATDSIIQIFNGIGRKGEDDFPDVFRDLLPELKRIASSGTEKQAKHAVYCITNLWPKDATILNDIFEEINQNIEIRNPHIEAVFASLSAIARLRPTEFHDKLKAIVSVKVVKSIILHDEAHTGCNADNELDRTWLGSEEISVEAKAKISAVKFLVYRLLGMKSNEDNHGVNTLKLLNGLIESGGNLQEIKMRYSEKAQLRLVAGCYFIKLLREKMFVDLMTLRQYVNLCYLICDECPQVREKFATKMHKNLYALRLPLEMMAAFALVPLIKPVGSSSSSFDESLAPFGAEEAKEAAKRFRSQVRDSILLNYRRRKDYLRKNPNLQSLPWKYLPEYFLSFAVYLLSHFNDFDSCDDIEALRDLRECMWFVLEPMLSRKDADRANPQFLCKMLRDIKHTRDVADPEDLEQAKKMWAMCDLGILLINNRFVSSDASTSQFKSLLSKRFFTQPKRGYVATNTEVYLPAIIIHEENVSPAVRAVKPSRGGIYATGRSRGGARAGGAASRSAAATSNGYDKSGVGGKHSSGGSTSDDEAEGTDEEQYGETAYRRSAQRARTAGGGGARRGGGGVRRRQAAAYGGSRERDSASPSAGGGYDVPQLAAVRSSSRPSKVSSAYRHLARGGE